MMDPSEEDQKDAMIKDNNVALESETEDEEVKRNCIMGISSLRDSDFSDTEDEDEEQQQEEENIEVQPEEEAEDAMEEKEEPKMLVQFVSSGQMPSKGVFLYRPTPIAAKLPTHHEEIDEDETVSSCSDSEEEEAEQGASKFCQDTPEIPKKRNQDFYPASSEDESDIEEASDDCDQRETSAPVSSSPPQEEANGCSDSDSDSVEDHEQDDGVIMLVAEEPAAITDESDEPLVQEPTEPEEDDCALIGATVDDQWTWSKNKRVLSSNTLASLNGQAGRNADTLKRVRPDVLSTDPPPTMPELSLGLTVFNHTTLLPQHDVIRDESPLLSSDEEEEMLSEELVESMRDVRGDNSPIPLLTPPQSPGREDEVEWPSNLVIDSALMNSVNERPLSPGSLQDMEEEEEHRLRSHDVEASTLTPLLRSIHVGMT
ncbi:hypothetical protein IV203_001912 [Nitzschia inconspicua]|uniref:Uncharacterized protein n=1 Tax=Nitzschia inconspicua TaxID=303405 RepID=A0A9K3PU24_9STRA|nr:hypothetical protein IV203_001912 [Nitzschia inconspicua]